MAAEILKHESEVGRRHGTQDVIHTSDESLFFAAWKNFFSNSLRFFSLDAA
jgi:hypothetical protein